MKSRNVKDVMVPLSEYGTIQQDMMLNVAVDHLRSIKTNSLRNPSLHDSVLVVDDGGRVVGQLGPLDLIVGLEENYRRIGDMEKVAHFGYDPRVIRSIIEQHKIWQKPLEQICAKADRIKVKDIMYIPTRSEYVDMEASLDIAMYQMGMGRYQTLLVTEKEQIVGVLRLSDIYDMVDAAIKECKFGSTVQR